MKNLLSLDSMWDEIVEKSDDERVLRLERSVRETYEDKAISVPFHGWHHIAFVRMKAIQFAADRGADALLVEISALVHDLNYIVRKNSEPEAGRKLRESFLRSAGFEPPTMHRVERIIDEAHTATRTQEISLEGAALSDADTLFKALPMTPVVFSHLYLSENGIGLRDLGNKILGEQLPLIDRGIYFYDPALRERYLSWAEANLNLWKAIMDSLEDPDVKMLLGAIGVRV